MRLFLVWNSEGVSEHEDTIVEDLFRAGEESDDDAPRKKGSVKRKKELTSSEAGGEEDSEEDGSQSSSDEKARQAFSWAVQLISGSPLQQVLYQLMCSGKHFVQLLHYTGFSIYYNFKIYKLCVLIHLTSQPIDQATMNQIQSTSTITMISSINQSLQSINQPMNYNQQSFIHAFIHSLRSFMHSFIHYSFIIYYSFYKSIN